MVDLAASVLPVFTNPDNTRWGAAEVFGFKLNYALDVLEQEAESGDPAQVYAVTTEALTAMRRVYGEVQHDPEEVMLEICGALLELHPQVAVKARVPTGKLVDWMMSFQFDPRDEYLMLDPVAYAPALGELGMASYRARLASMRRELLSSVDGPEDGRWFVLEWQGQRLAVLDRDVDAIIETHLGDRTSADQFVQAALAFDEIDEPELAILWAQRGAYFDLSAEAFEAGDLWCTLLAERQPDELLEARLAMLRRWPGEDTAKALFEVAGPAWPEYQEEVLRRLSDDPAAAVRFAFEVLGQLQLAWDLAHDLGLNDLGLWVELAGAYLQVDALAVLPVFEWLVYTILQDSQAKAYRVAAEILTSMREIAAGTEHQGYVEELIERLPVEFPRRPLMVRAFRDEGLNRPLRPRAVAEPTPVVEPVEPAEVQLLLG